MCKIKPNSQFECGSFKSRFYKHTVTHNHLNLWYDDTVPSAKIEKKL